MIINPEKEAIVKAINDLYILNRWKYLILNNNGNYSTKQYYKNNKDPNNKDKPLSDWMVYHHINGKHTLGVFSGKKDNIEISKFLTFDVDVRDKEMAKHTVYRIVHVLQDIGIEDDFIHISLSGNKGFHIDIFFDYPIENNLLKQFYAYVLSESDLLNIDYGEVELRPTYTQGVKIPLGINFKNTNILTNQCLFCNYSNGLKPIIDPLYITKIKKMDNILFRLILDKVLDIEELEASDKNISDYIETKEAHKPLPIYKQNIDEDITIEAIENLIETGLTRTGMRWNTLKKMAKYYKHLEVSKEDCKEWVTEWMNQQDKKCYTTKWEQVLKDIDNIIDYTYTHNCSLVVGNKTVKITYSEIKEILKAKSKNEKLVLYSMLIHSKRYAKKSGVFYFPFSLMEQATNLTSKTIRKIINKLEDNNYIEIVSRNIAVEHKFMKEPNKYKVTLNIVEDKEVENKCFEFNEGDNYMDSFNECIITNFENKDIKILLGRRHYEELMDYKDNLNNTNTNTNTLEIGEQGNGEPNE